jgi:hypothetical protein
LHSWSRALSQNAEHCAKSVATETPSFAGTSDVRVQSCALDTFSIEPGQSVSCLIAVCCSNRPDKPAGNYGNAVSYLWKLGVIRVSAGVGVSVVVTNVGAGTWAALCDCFPEHFGRLYKNIA